MAVVPPRCEGCWVPCWGEASHQLGVLVGREAAPAACRAGSLLAGLLGRLLAADGLHRRQALQARKPPLEAAPGSSGTEHRGWQMRVGA